MKKEPIKEAAYIIGFSILWGFMIHGCVMGAVVAPFEKCNSVVAR